MMALKRVLLWLAEQLFLLKKVSLKKLNNAGYTVVVWKRKGDDPIYGGKERKEMGVFSVGTNPLDIPTKQITNNISCIWTERFKESIIKPLEFSSDVQQLTSILAR